MVNLQQQFSELIALTQQFLQQNPEIQNASASSQDYHFFGKWMAPQREPSTTAPKEEGLQKKISSKPPSAPPKLYPSKQSATSAAPIPNSAKATPSLAVPLASSPPISTAVRAPAPSPPPPSQQTAPEAKSTGEFRLEPIKAALPLDVQEFAALLTVHAPHCSLRSEIPNDSAAKAIKEQWKIRQQMPAVVILSFDDGKEGLEFLKSVADAITARFAPARVFPALRIEQENKWDSLFQAPELRLIIAEPQALQKIPTLLKYHQESGESPNKKLNQIPFIPIDALSYPLDPHQKRQLWRSICDHFNALL